MHTRKVAEATKCASPRCRTIYGRRHVINVGQEAYVGPAGALYCSTRCLHNGPRKPRPSYGRTGDHDPYGAIERENCSGLSTRQEFEDPLGDLRRGELADMMDRDREDYQANAD